MSTRKNVNAAPQMRPRRSLFVQNVNRPLDWLLFALVTYDD